MKNTGIVYSSTEKTPVVLPELAGLLPPLTGEQFAILEEDLRENGCYSPLIVDENLTVIDGHNRHTLCEKHGIPYQMRVFHFDDTLEAMKWAVDTQKGRRNLDKWELGKIALKLKPALEAKAKANMSAGGGFHGNHVRKKTESRETAPLRTDTGKDTLPQTNNDEVQTNDEKKSGCTKSYNLTFKQTDTSQCPEQTSTIEESNSAKQNEIPEKMSVAVSADMREGESPYPVAESPISERVDTLRQLAASVGIGRETMNKVIQIDGKAPQAVKDALDRKEISVNQAYQITRQMQEVPEEERAQAARLAVEEEKIRKKLRKSDAETDRRAKISKQFCDAFAQSFELQPTEENIGYWVDFCCMRTRNLKEAIDEARVLSRLYASIEKKLREMYPEASAALDADDAKKGTGAEEDGANE